MNNPKVYWGIKIVVMMLLFFTVVSYVLMLLWNWLVPDLFGGPLINFWKAAGLLLLSKIIFSGFHKKKWSKHDHATWKNQFVHKQHLTPEQKQELKEKFVNKWCRPPMEEKPEDDKTSQESNIQS